MAYDWRWQPRGAYPRQITRYVRFAYSDQFETSFRARVPRWVKKIEKKKLYCAIFDRYLTITDQGRIPIALHNTKLAQFLPRIVDTVVAYEEGQNKVKFVNNFRLLSLALSSARRQRSNLVP